MAKTASLKRVPFKTILARAEKRKGGPKALQKLLPARPNKKTLEKLTDDRILAEDEQTGVLRGLCLERDREQMVGV